MPSSSDAVTNGKIVFFNIFFSCAGNGPGVHDGRKYGSERALQFARASPAITLST